MAGLCKALARRGHRVTFFERDVPYYASHRDLGDPETFDLVLYPEWAQVRERAKIEVRDCDAALVTSYCPDARAAADLVLSSAKTLKVFYDLDTPVTLERIRQGEEVNYIPSYGLGPFDLVLSYTGGKALDELRAQLGARRVAALYGSVDPSLHKPAARSSRYSSDLLPGHLCFRPPTGAAGIVPRTSQALPGEKVPDRRCALPARFSRGENIWFVRHVPPPEHPTFYSSSALTLSVTRAAMAEMGYCPSGRLFEAAACGTPVISDQWDGMRHSSSPARKSSRSRPPPTWTTCSAWTPRRSGGWRSVPVSVLSTNTPRTIAVRPCCASWRRPRDAHLGGDTRRRPWHSHPAVGVFQGTAACGIRQDSKGAERPRAVSEYLVDRMLLAGVTRICFVGGSLKTTSSATRRPDGKAAICYARPAESCGAVRRSFCRSPFLGEQDEVLIGLPDTIWFPETGFGLPAGEFLSCYFPATSRNSSTRW